MTDDQLGEEDIKIITLARSARARVGSAEGAAVRDETGRTYAAASIALPSLRLSALALAVAMAASSGAASLEAAALVSDGQAPGPADVAAVRGGMNQARRLAPSPPRQYGNNYQVRQGWRLGLR